MAIIGAFAFILPIIGGQQNSRAWCWGLIGGGACRGLLFKVAPQAALAVSHYLWRREMIGDVYRPSLVSALYRKGHERCEVTAWTFVVDPKGRQYCPDLPIEKMADMIAKAQGLAGHNHDYLYQTHAHLCSLAIKDRQLAKLVEAVAQKREGLKSGFGH
jgi:glutathione-specific gamma-glutamylcyclotransferase